jgi:hypothetical protein
MVALIEYKRVGVVGPSTDVCHAWPVIARSSQATCDGGSARGPE